MPRRSADTLNPTPWIRHFAKIPERDLGETVLDAAQPLFDELGPQPSRKAIERAIASTVKMWNAIIVSREHYPHPQVGPLNRIRKSFASKRAGEAGVERLTMLLRHVHHKSLLDPRLVNTWSYEQGEDGTHRLVCTMKLPLGIEAEVPPPIEKRIAVGGVFFDQVRIRWLSPGQSLKDLSLRSYPIDSHHAFKTDDGSIVIRTHSLVAMQIFAEGLLPPVGSVATDLEIGGRRLDPMKVASLHCVDDYGRGAIAVIVLQPA